MKEQNKETLKSAIGQLPEYFPDPANWDHISQALDQDGLVSETIGRLPEYEPPKAVWNQLAQKLEKKHRVIQLPIRRWAAAAAIILGVSSLITYRLWSGEQNIDLAYTEEQVNQFPLTFDWDRDEADFAEIMNLYQSKAFLHSNAVYRSGKTELEELAAAREELKEIAKLYGLDQELIHQVKEIELERTAVAKELYANNFKLVNY